MCHRTGPQQATACRKLSTFLVLYLSRCSQEPEGEAAWEAGTDRVEWAEPSWESTRQHEEQYSSIRTFPPTIYRVRLYSILGGRAARTKITPSIYRTVQPYTTQDSARDTVFLNYSSLTETTGPRETRYATNLERSEKRTPRPGRQGFQCTVDSANTRTRVVCRRPCTWTVVRLRGVRY